MIVPVPSGAAFEVDAPQLRAVLIEGGSDEALISAIWRHQMDAEKLLPEDRTFLKFWCIQELAGDEEAAALAGVCERFGGLPSQRLRIDDPVAAFICDKAFSVTLAKARGQVDDEELADEAEDGETPRGHIHFTTEEAT